MMFSINANLKFFLQFSDNKTQANLRSTGQISKFYEILCKNVISKNLIDHLKNITSGKPLSKQCQNTEKIP